MSDKYAVIKVTVRRLGVKAAHLEIGGVQHWIARSLIHGADDMDLRKGETKSIRIFAWKVREIEKGATDAR